VHVCNYIPDPDIPAIHIRSDSFYDFGVVNVCDTPAPVLYTTCIVTTIVIERVCVFCLPSLVHNIL